jgi:hypothetical protein
LRRLSVQEAAKKGRIERNPNRSPNHSAREDTGKAIKEAQRDLLTFQRVNFRNGSLECLLRLLWFFRFRHHRAFVRAARNGCLHEILSFPFTREFAAAIWGGIPNAGELWNFS